MARLTMKGTTLVRAKPVHELGKNVKHQFLGYIISQSGAQFTVVVEDRLNKHGTLAARLFLE